MGGVLTQIFPPAPTYTEQDIPSLQGKVFIVTGGNVGIGVEIVKILYSKGGTIYIASRSPSKLATAISTIQSEVSTATPGALHSLNLDLSDLHTIKPCVQTFLSSESRLDVLFNNAGIAHVPEGSTSAQGHEAQVATNCIGPFLLTHLLTPILLSTAKKSPPASVRVVFTSSSIVDAAPVGGLDLSALEPDPTRDRARNYAASKVGNWFLASEFSRRVFRTQGIVSLSLNPGNLRTKGWDGLWWPLRWLFKPILREPRLGALTSLWVGLSPKVDVGDGSRFAIPWGRWHPCPREDLLLAMRSKEEMGTGQAGEFWDWCEERTKEFA